MPAPSEKCDDCGEEIRVAAVNVRRSGPTSGKQYSRGKSAETSVKLAVVCGCRKYYTKSTEDLGSVKISGHAADAWANDGKELDGTEHSKED